MWRLKCDNVVNVFKCVCNDNAFKTLGAVASGRNVVRAVANRNSLSVCRTVLSFQMNFLRLSQTLLTVLPLLGSVLGSEDMQNTLASTSCSADGRRSWKPLLP